ncbi:unnamed protein product [Meganyctiphanes norvegica]|uniref:Ankyrin repeat domain-containing protein n=1 Tax=Meganyctiphanes norvegica TaxID=48144 RepID=A0AAV2Q862_MEGNR
MCFSTALCLLVILGSVLGNSEKDLWQAAQDGDLERVNKELGKGTSALWQNPDNYGITAIHVASEQNNVDIVSALLDAGVDINLQDKNGCTALFWAAGSASQAVASMLIQRGANVDLPSDVGRTPLMMPIYSFDENAIDTVKVLLDGKANVNLADDGYWTALHHAANMDEAGIVQALLQKGADTKAKTKEGHTPGALAKEQGYTELGNNIDNFTGVPVMPTPPSAAKPTQSGQKFQQNFLMMVFICGVVMPIL